MQKREHSLDVCISFIKLWNIWCYRKLAKLVSSLAHGKKISKMRYYSSGKSRFNRCASGVFLFWEELKLWHFKHNIYCYVIYLLKNICIALAQHRGEAIKRHKLWNASFHNLIEGYVFLKLDRPLVGCRKQCGMKIVLLKEMTILVA